MLRTTGGQLSVNESLPPDLRDYTRVLDKEGLNTLLRSVAEKYPEQYRRVSKELSDQGRFHAQRRGGYSFDISHLKKSPAAAAIQRRLQPQIDRVLANRQLSPREVNQQVVSLVKSAQKEQIDAVYKHALETKNPLAMQVKSGSRGNPAQLNSLIGGDLLYEDSNNNAIPVPVFRSYSQGLSLGEYWASAAGARRGVVDVKKGVANAGYFEKLLNQVSHRNVVVDHDAPEELDDDDRPLGQVRGLPVDTDDSDNEGALLAKDFGPYKQNTVLTPKILQDLRRKGHGRILVRSPVAHGAPDGGVYSYDVGLREGGKLVAPGESIGMTGSQALGEPAAQGTLSSKHAGGVAGQTAVSGFKALEQVIQIPDVFRGAAAHAQKDGRVGKVERAPAGGHFVYVDSAKHHVPEGFAVTVKPGQSVEAGDVLSEGMPNPEEVTRHKGIGEGRRYYLKAFKEAARINNVKTHRRNVELLAKGLINHVRLTEPIGDFAPDDIVPYHRIESEYRPRPDAERVKPDQASGKYLERPVLHYTIGTRVTPQVMEELKSFEVPHVFVHSNPPGFVPEMVRASDNLLHDPDPLTRMYGSNLQKGLLKAVHRGDVSDANSTSFVPAMVTGIHDFGRKGIFSHKTPAMPLPPEGKPLPKAASAIPTVKFAYDPDNPFKMPNLNSQASNALQMDAPSNPFAKQPLGNPMGGMNPYSSGGPKPVTPQHMTGHAPQQSAFGSSPIAKIPQAQPWQQSHEENASNMLADFDPSNWSKLTGTPISYDDPGQHYVGDDGAAGPMNSTRPGAMFLQGQPGQPAAAEAPAQPPPQQAAQPRPPSSMTPGSFAGGAAVGYGANRILPKVTPGLAGAGIKSLARSGAVSAAFNAGDLGWRALSGQQVTGDDVKDSALDTAAYGLGGLGLGGGLRAGYQELADPTPLNSQDAIAKFQATPEGRAQWATMTPDQKQQVAGQNWGADIDRRSEALKPFTDPKASALSQAGAVGSVLGTGVKSMFNGDYIRDARAVVQSVKDQGELRDRTVAGARNANLVAQRTMQQAQANQHDPKKLKDTVENALMTQADAEVTEMLANAPLAVSGASEGTDKQGLFDTQRGWVFNAVREKAYDRARARAALSIDDKLQTLKPEDRQKLERQVTSLTSTINDTKQQITSGVFGPGTLAKALLPDESEAKTPPVDQQVAQSPEFRARQDYAWQTDRFASQDRVSWDQAGAAYRLHGLNKQYRNIRQQMEQAANDPVKIDKLQTERAEMERKIQEEQRRLKS